MIPAWAGKYVGLPFHERGTDLTAPNCWNLVRVVLEQEAGVVGLSTYDAVSADDIGLATNVISCEAAKDPWVNVGPCPRRMFDCVVLRGHPLHVGILVDDANVLHIWRQTNSVIMPLSHIRIRNRIAGFYRHRSLQ